MRKLYFPVLFLDVRFIPHVKGTTLIAYFIGRYPLYFATYKQNGKKFDVQMRHAPCVVFNI